MVFRYVVVLVELLRFVFCSSPRSSPTITSNPAITPRQTTYFFVRGYDYTSDVRTDCHSLGQPHRLHVNFHPRARPTHRYYKQYYYFRYDNANVARPKCVLITILRCIYIYTRNASFSRNKIVFIKWLHVKACARAPQFLTHFCYLVFIFFRVTAIFRVAGRYVHV